MCAQDELRINNTFFQHKQSQKYTFGNTRNQKSSIDFVISNWLVHPSQILDVRTLTSANVGTEHGLVQCKYRCKAHTSKKKPPVYIEKYNLEGFRDDSTKLMYGKRLEEKLRLMHLREAEDVNTMWSKIKACIIDSAKEAIGVRRINMNGRKQFKPWFTDDVKQLAKRKKDVFLQYKNTMTGLHMRSTKQLETGWMKV